VRWETNVRGNAPKYFFHGDVFVAPNRIIATADVDPGTGVEAGVHAFDRDSGRQLWMYPSGRGVLGAVIGLGRRAYAFASTGDLIALGLQTGTLEWRYPLKAPGWESPAALGPRVFAASSDGSVYALHSETGHMEWQQQLGVPTNASVRATASDVYVGTSDGMMHRLAAASGEKRSSLKVDPALKPSSSPVLTQDALLVLLADQGANYRALVSLDTTLSRVKWRRAATDRWSTTRVFATTKNIVLGTPSGEVTAYCTADGAPAWSHKLADAPIRSIGGSDEILYVGTPQGTLYAIRPPHSCL
jgi:outer membrane protein assembly factor BamB